MRDKDARCLYVFVLCMCAFVTGFDVGQKCVEGQNIYGAQNPNQFTGYLDKRVYTGYLIFGGNPLTKADCCGVIDKWSIVANLQRTGKVRTLALQVWRPSANNTHVYTLVGQNTYGISRDGAQLIGTGFNRELLIMKGDRFGWYADFNMIEHNSYTSTVSDVVLYKEFERVPPVGRTVVDWSTASVANKTGYALQIRTKRGSYPKIYKPIYGEVFTVPNWYTTGAHVTNITYFDADVGDALALSVTFQNDTQFAYSNDQSSTNTEGTVRVYVKSATLRVGSEPVIFSVKDRCGQSTDVRFEIRVIEVKTTQSVGPPSTTASSPTSSASLSTFKQGGTSISLSTTVGTTSSILPSTGITIISANSVYICVIIGALFK